MMKEDVPTTSKAEVPEASPEANAASTATKSPKPSRRGLYLALGVALVIVATLCIVLPLTLVPRNSTSSTSTSSSTVSTSAASVPPPSTGNSNTDSSTPTTSTATTTTTTTSTKSPKIPVSTTKQGFLPLYGPGVTNGYSSPEELEAALTIALTSQASNIVQRQLHPQSMYYGKETLTDAMPMASETAADGASPAASGSGPTEEEGVTDFETNNQEDNVDEADM
jgi:hypothetical protein